MKRTLFVCIALISIVLLAAGNVKISITQSAWAKSHTPPFMQNLPALLEDLNLRLTEVETTVEGLSSLVTFEERLQAVEASSQAGADKLQYVRIETGVINGLTGPHMIIGGANVHIRHSLAASGQTYGTSSFGLGNLVIGWNEDLSGQITANDRLASHNLIIGADHKYTNSGCFLAGHQNTASGIGSSVSGGKNNTASGSYSSVSGGVWNEASGGAFLASAVALITRPAPTIPASAGAYGTRPAASIPASAVAIVTRPAAAIPASVAAERTRPAAAIPASAGAINAL